MEQCFRCRGSGRTVACDLPPMRNIGVLAKEGPNLPIRTYNVICPDCRGSGYEFGKQKESKNEHK